MVPIEQVIYENGRQPKRLDRFLALVFPDYSRSYFQRLITEGCVLVNGKAILKASHVLRDLDKIQITFQEKKPVDLTPRKVDFDVVGMQDDFLVVHKPAGLIVHVAASTSPDEATLVHGLLYAFKELQAFKDTERPGIVHRLDKNTSGLLLVARNPSSLYRLANLFKERKVKKTYLAVVKGHPPREGKIDYPIGRHPTQTYKMSHQGFQARDALTYFKVLKYYKETTLLSVSPVTGRTHQIRVHLAAIGHGIIGDTIYGYHSKLIARQALHSWKLSFLYNEIQYFYFCFVPNDMKLLLKKLSIEKT